MGIDDVIGAGIEVGIVTCGREDIGIARRVVGESRAVLMSDRTGSGGIEAEVGVRRGEDDTEAGAERGIDQGGKIAIASLHRGGVGHQDDESPMLQIIDGGTVAEIGSVEDDDPTYEKYSFK